MSTTTPFLIRNSVLLHFYERYYMAEALKRDDEIGELAVSIHFGQSLSTGVRVNADLGLLNILARFAGELEVERIDNISQGLFDDVDRSTALLLNDVRRTAKTLRRDVLTATRILLRSNGF